MSDRTDAASKPRGIDPRGPRFAAGITALLLLVDVFLGLTTPIGATVAERAAEPAFLLLVVIALLFLWGVLSPRTAPWGVLYRTLIQPRLTPPTDLEDPRPPRFAQGVGLFVVTIGLILHLAGRPVGTPDRGRGRVRRRVPQRRVRPVPGLPALPGSAARRHRRSRATRHGLNRSRATGVPRLG